MHVMSLWNPCFSLYSSAVTVAGEMVRSELTDGWGFSQLIGRGYMLSGRSCSSLWVDQTETCFDCTTALQQPTIGATAAACTLHTAVPVRPLVADENAKRPICSSPWDHSCLLLAVYEQLHRGQLESLARVDLNGTWRRMTLIPSDRFLTFRVTLQ